MKFKLSRKTIAICSLVLMLFVIGYAYNAFMSTKYEPLGFDIDENDLSEFPAYNDAAEVAGNNKEGSVTVVESKGEDDQEVSSFFTEYKLERDKNRTKEYDMWQNIIDSDKAEPTFKTLAQEEIVKIVALTEKEMIIENLILARGFKDALVFLTDDSATVVVEAKELTPASVAKIQDIVMTNTKIPASNIKIMLKD
ncbi:SpoIIIAH-like family protein [Lutispora sp.]|uniref:SpoIIIAH-like family protein n=1 Tax=Lutispora sp. TaxID=2828727 RepID=UPI002B200D1B|nr:SpoIIIAH-like family protein [Lutispora sp.]MEA4963890.1 SpoIIIAH-like family protein [Lutispora sp.]